MFKVLSYIRFSSISQYIYISPTKMFEVLEYSLFLYLICFEIIIIIIITTRKKKILVLLGRQPKPIFICSKQIKGLNY